MDPNKVEDPQKLREDLERIREDIRKVRKVVNGEMESDEDAEVYFLLGNYDDEQETLQVLLSNEEDIEERLKRAEKGEPRL